jgi:hypothetical protein
MMTMLHLATFAPLISLKAGAFMGLLRDPQAPWPPKRRPKRSGFGAINPFSLVVLADQEVADGHIEQARLLLEAAYIAFDRGCAD